MRKSWLYGGVCGILCLVIILLIFNSRGFNKVTFWHSKENKPVKSEEMIKSFDDTELFLKKDIPANPKAIIVILHGLRQHSGRYDYVTRKFNEYGYGVYRYDQRGNGKSDGQYLEDFQWFIDDANVIVNLVKKENPGVPVFMLGHSMGGFFAAGYGTKYPNKLAGQIFSGAAVIQSAAFASLKNIDINTVSPTKP